MSTVYLKLFVTGSMPRSQDAIESVRRILSENTPKNWELSVVDVTETPEEAEEHRIIATPTLLRVSPPPVRRVIGDISDPITLLQALDLRAGTTSTDGRRR